jgi:hypothetical protein
MKVSHEGERRDVAERGDRSEMLILSARDYINVSIYRYAYIYVRLIRT